MKKYMYVAILLCAVVAASLAWLPSVAGPRAAKIQTALSQALQDRTDRRAQFVIFEWPDFVRIAVGVKSARLKMFCEREEGRLYCEPAEGKGGSGRLPPILLVSKTTMCPDYESFKRSYHKVNIQETVIHIRVKEYHRDPVPDITMEICDGDESYLMAIDVPSWTDYTPEQLRELAESFYRVKEPLKEIFEERN